MSTRPGDSADDDRPADGNDRPRPSSPADPDAEFAWLRPYVSGPAFIFITSNVGFVLVALAQFCFACMNITVKYFLSITPVTVTTLILVRMGISSVGSILALYLMGDPNPVLGPPEMRRYLYARGVAGFVGLFAAYKSYIGLSVSDSMAIGYLTPSLSAIFAFFFLGERCSRREILAGVACLGGVLLISRPPMIFGEYGSGEGSPADETGGAPPPDVPAMSRMQGVAWALVGVCGATMAYLLIRKIGHRVHALHTMGIFAHMCTVVCLFVTIVTPGPTAWVTSLREFILIITIGIFGFGGQICLTLGLQRERVGKAGVALYLSVFYSIILELFVFHTFPAFLSILGIMVILSSAYWVAKGGMKKEETRIDIESQPLSRSPSPSPSPSPVQRPRTLSAAHRSYSSTANDAAELKSQNGFLQVQPVAPARQNGGASDISGFTSSSSSR